jgi:hypothetical protein
VAYGAQKLARSNMLGAQKLARSSMLGFDSSHIPESHIGAFSSQPPEEMKLLFLNEIDAQNFIFQ